MLQIIKNTYPKHPKVAYGNIGDLVEWQLYRGRFNLVRKSDGKTIFSTANVDKDGLLQSNKNPPKLLGVIGQIRNKGWIIEVGKAQ